MYSAVVQPALYVEANELQRRDSEDVVRRFGPRVRWPPSASSKNGAVLDVGCGTGDVTAGVLLPALPPSVRRVVGADVSPAMVGHARSNFGRRDPRLRFLQADIAEPTLDARALWEAGGGGRFCGLFSFYCLHWVIDQRTALKNMFQLMAPGAEALLMFLAHCDVFSAYEALATDSRWKSCMTDVSKYLSPYHHSIDAAHDFATLAKDVGFEIVGCENEERKYEFKTVEGLFNAVKAVNPFLKKVPQEEHTEFLQEIISEMYISTQRKKERGSDMNYNLVIGHLRKPLD